LKQLMTVVANSRQFKVSDRFLNRRKDYKDGRFSRIVSNTLNMKLRDDLKRLKKIRADTPSAPSDQPTSDPAIGGSTWRHPTPLLGPTARPM
ncbi:hypothetical protein BAE44_0016550, partial [Dichanthelium oligosanthes]